MNILSITIALSSVCGIASAAGGSLRGGRDLGRGASTHIEEATALQESITRALESVEASLNVPGETIHHHQEQRNLVQSCGQVVHDNTIDLTEDLECPVGSYGFYLLGHATIDCQGHTIRSLGGDTSFGLICGYGECEFKNCVIEDFGIGFVAGAGNANGVPAAPTLTNVSILGSKSVGIAGSDGPRQENAIIALNNVSASDGLNGGIAFSSRFTYELNNVSVCRNDNLDITSTDTTNPNVIPAPGGCNGCVSSQETSGSFMFGTCGPNDDACEDFTDIRTDTC